MLILREKNLYNIHWDSIQNFVYLVVFTNTQYHIVNSIHVYWISFLNWGQKSSVHKSTLKFRLWIFSFQLFLYFQILSFISCTFGKWLLYMLTISIKTKHSSVHFIIGIPRKNLQWFLVNFIFFFFFFEEMMEWYIKNKVMHFAHNKLISLENSSNDKMSIGIMQFSNEL